MNFKEGFCRIETKDRIIFGEITEIFNDFICVVDFMPPAFEIDIQKKDIVRYESIKEEDIPPYE